MDDFCNIYVIYGHFPSSNLKMNQLAKINHVSELRKHQTNTVQIASPSVTRPVDENSPFKQKINPKMIISKNYDTSF